MERKWWTLIVVCVGIFMLLLDVTIVNVALPDIQSDLDSSFSQLQWVIDAYALSLAALVLTAGSLADLYGRRLLFALGVLVFTAGSLLCGISPTATFLDLARACRGSAARSCSPPRWRCSPNEFHGRERGTAFGIWGATTGGAVAIGPLAGGIVTERLGWRWIFLLNVPIGIAALVVTLLRVGESRDPEHGGVDLGGVLTFSGGLFLLVYGLVRGNTAGWGSMRDRQLRSSPPPSSCSPSWRSSSELAPDARPRASSACRPSRAPRSRRSRSRRRRSRSSSTSRSTCRTSSATRRSRPDPLPPDLAARVRRRADLREALEPRAVRALIGGGLAVCTLAFVLMHGITPDVGLELAPPRVHPARHRDRARQPAARLDRPSASFRRRAPGWGQARTPPSGRSGSRRAWRCSAPSSSTTSRPASGAAGRAAATGVVPPSLREPADGRIRDRGSTSCS